MNIEGAVERFRRAIRIKTDWPGEDSPELTKAAERRLEEFQEFLLGAYPGFHRVTERRVFGPFAVVYRWPGADAAGIGGGNAAADAGVPPGGPEAPGVLILAHYDVVPVEAAKWTVDPFGGEVKDGFIYGRGAQDMKGSLIAILEAAEELAERGFRPRRDIWFAFGGDEERSGVLGARNTAAWFAEKGRCFSWILDEGSPVAINQIRGVTTPLALFGVEEKGFLSLTLEADQKPGHASQPPRVQAAAVLARALLRINRRPFPARLGPVVASFFSRVAELKSRPSGGPGAKKGPGAAILTALGPLLSPFFAFVFRGNPQILAMLRTTVAMTQLSGSAADNVMPSQVRAVINLRLLAPETVEGAVSHITGAVGDERVKVSVLGLATGPVGAHQGHGRMEEGPGWEEMAKATAAVFPDAVPLPFIMTATTDSRHYQALAEGIFRFSPMRLSPEDLSAIHGHDERISLENFFLAARFYTALFELL